MSITILKPGLLTTMQDAGRFGYQHLGINPSGAMDIRAMQIANALVLNKLEEAVLEFFFPAPVIQFNQSTFIALSGADFGAEIEGIAIPINHPVFVPANTVLQFSVKKTKQIGYLSVQGGFDLSEWLNSNSTNLKVSAGGHEGRSLSVGDRIGLNTQSVKSISNSTCSVLPWKASVEEFYTNHALRFIPGNEFNLLNDESKNLFCSSSFTILPQSDRMGYRLNGPTLQLSEPLEMISTAVTRGTIQLLPSGQCIVLMADNQTTGGYPRIGHIISADFSNLAQKGATDLLYFSETTIELAEKLLHNHKQHLHQLKNACILQLDAYHRH